MKGKSEGRKSGYLFYLYLLFVKRIKEGERVSEREKEIFLFYYSGDMEIWEGFIVDIENKKEGAYLPRQ